MEENNIYQMLGKMTEEMYFQIAKAQSSIMQDQLIEYHTMANQKINELIQKMSDCDAGEILLKQKRKIQILNNDFYNMKNDLGSKYKVYLRGCGKAGKSTLLNALLSIDEKIGSRMGRVPMTFTIDTYTDELQQDKAEVRLIDSKGIGENLRVSREKAIEMENSEELKFRKSKEKCEKIIQEKVKDSYLEQVREDIETDVYKQYLMKTAIREIVWGIGENHFFHNCVLIDTPGLSQELRFTNAIEDIKNYEIDGIIWVISSDTLAKAEVVEAYQKEFKELESVYANKKVVGVVNMYGTGEDYKYGSKLWNRVKKRAEAFYCGQYNFNEVICVNAKLAYDGNKKHDKKMIEDSNISELRKKINEMFIEKSSEEYHNSKLEKVNMFLDNLYKETETLCDELKKKIKLYDDKKAKIISQKSACEELLESKKNKVISRHLAEVRNRIDANAGRIQNLDYESSYQREAFLENTIICVDDLEEKIYSVVEKCEDIIFKRFKEQQRQSIISNFKTEEYALENFKKNMGSMAQKKAEHVSISSPKGIGLEIYNVITGIFGDKGIIASFVRGVRNMIKSPQDRAYESVSNDIWNWASEITLTEEINGYGEHCFEILDKSMETACGSYQDTCKISEFMEEFMKNRQPMVWEKIGLIDMLGDEASA